MTGQFHRSGNSGCLICAPVWVISETIQEGCGGASRTTPSVLGIKPHEAKSFRKGTRSKNLRRMKKSDVTHCCRKDTNVGVVGLYLFFQTLNPALYMVRLLHGIAETILYELSLPMPPTLSSLPEPPKDSLSLASRPCSRLQWVVSSATSHSPSPR